MVLAKNIPGILPMKDWRIEVEHDKQTVQCRNCYRFSHYAKHCPNERVEYGTYSVVSNERWGSVKEQAIVNEIRLKEVVETKKHVEYQARKGIKAVNIKS